MAAPPDPGLNLLPFQQQDETGGGVGYQGALDPTAASSTLGTLGSGLMGNLPTALSIWGQNAQAQGYTHDPYAPRATSAIASALAGFGEGRAARIALGRRAAIESRLGMPLDFFQRLGPMAQTEVLRKLGLASGRYEDWHGAEQLQKVDPNTPLDAFGTNPDTGKTYTHGDIMTHGRAAIPPSAGSPSMPFSGPMQEGEQRPSTPEIPGSPAYPGMPPGSSFLPGDVGKAMERALTPIPGTGPGSKGSVAPTGKVGAAGKGAGASAYERKLDLIAAGLGPGWTREKVAAGLVTGSLSPAKGSVYEKRINSIAMGLGGAVKGWTPEKVSAALATGQIKVLGPAQVQLNNVDAAGRVLGSTKFDVPAGTSVPGAPTSPAPEDMESITINGQTFTGTHQQVADYRAAHPGLK